MGSGIIVMLRDGQGLHLALCTYSGAICSARINEGLTASKGTVSSLYNSGHLFDSFYVFKYVSEPKQYFPLQIPLIKCNNVKASSYKV